MKNHLKRFCIVIVCLMVLAMAGCGGTGADKEQSGAGSAQIPVDGSADSQAIHTEDKGGVIFSGIPVDSDMREAILRLVEGNRKCFFDIYMIEPLEYDPFEHGVSLYWVNVVSDEFKTFSDLENYTRSIFCEEEANKLLYGGYGHIENPAYFELDGVFYVDTGVVGGMNYPSDWSDYSIEVVNLTDNMCEFNFHTGVYQTSGIDTPMPLTLKMKAMREDKQWRLEKMVFSEDGFDDIPSVSDVVPHEYLDRVFKTFAELKTEMPSLQYTGFETPFYDAAFPSYADSGQDKVYYCYDGAQSIYEGIPEIYHDNFSKIGELHVYGFHGDISALVPTVQKEMTVSELESLLGIKFSTDEFYPGHFWADYPECGVELSIKDESGMVKPDTQIGFIFDDISHEIVMSDKRIEENLWIEVDPEGAHEYYSYSSGHGGAVD